MKSLFYIILGISVAAMACSSPKAEPHTTSPVDTREAQIASASTEREKKLLARPVPEIGAAHQHDDEHYRTVLTEEEFYILREKGTERAFTGAYNKNHADGVYHCRACNAPLFTSNTKFESGTGWPSFYAPVKDRVATELDTTWGMQRTEIVCAHCKGHLGHVFKDGPEPTNLRYCVNSLSMVFNEGSPVDAQTLDLEPKVEH